MTDAPTDNLFFDVERSCTGKRWLERPGDSRQALAISQQFQLPEIIGRLLDARGISADQVDTFLDPKLASSLPDPAHLLDMDIGVTRLIQAIQGQEKIAVFGDYDVDGATSSALLARYFKAVGAEHQIYIPDRINEGYGPNIPALEKLQKDGAKVVVTVDCGTTAYEPLAFAKENKLDV
ncbi:MAG: single-stranded-DNA-specific exonuclease RecJ, partial [Rhodospirillaceae bacterium]|nr:single-stranded-DNA-specific exonuclease RecJ [Rhodospirillaceae bacterium]